MRRIATAETVILRTNQPTNRPTGKRFTTQASKDNREGNDLKP